MSVTSRMGRTLRDNVVTRAGLLYRPDMRGPSEAAVSTIIGDYWWGDVPPPIQSIPLTWLSDPVTLRLDQPLNYAEVTRVGGAIQRATNTTSVTSYKVFPFMATLDTVTDGDTMNLAHWTVTYFGEPRMRSPSLSVDLLYRTDAERQQILRLTVGRRIQISGVPPEFPTGASQLVITGIHHTAAVNSRMVTFTTGPVVGSTPGTPGPWFRLNTSALGGTDVMPA